ncbi:MAG TPA: DEAD/DEAH box helicase family protein [Candidatus Saccharimonadales bacterium]|nr:DEAD/DEAH box helicase family protein [Candidatus Saccharimonadales bacterium]
MKFQFQDNLDYQKDAIDAVISIFDTGKNKLSADQTSILTLGSITTLGNDLEIDNERILENVRDIQKDNSIAEVSEELGSLDFSIEMETGTGKTYVYLKTMLELNKRYGLSKFIILVPSVAIREGVMKTIKQTHEHFSQRYGQGIRAFEYDSTKLNKVRDFVTSPLMQVMVITVDSFNKEINVMRRTPDQFQGERPLDMISSTRPVVVMDEPQNMGSDLAKASISDLHPLFKLRYSATHKEKHNLLYSLGPEEAYNRRLVKKISVFGVENETFFNVLEIKKSPISAKVKVEVKKGDVYEVNTLTVRNGDYLSEETNNPKYGDLHITEIHAGQGYVELSDNSKHSLAKAIGEEDREKVFRLQIHETIKAHMVKQERMQNKVKVLSLFFIDKVANYQSEKGVIRSIFEDEFEKLKTHYEHFKNTDAKSVQGAYFAKKSKASDEFKDSSTGKSQSDKEAYDLIMKDKEKLLSFSKPTCFIFSHSALKEGWDNPNVFQICTLNETRSAIKKRQEIGRGLRLPVDINGNRIVDDQINVLTVVANESYKDFIETMQQEYREAGYINAPKADNARQKLIAKFKYDKQALPEQFAELWKRIRRKTRYHIKFDSYELINAVIERANELKPENMIIKLRKADISIKNGIISASYNSTAVGEPISTKEPIGDVVSRIAEETELTKTSVFRILSKLESLEYIKRNPEEYIRSLIVIINSEKLALVLSKGLHYQEVQDIWEIDIFDDIKAYATSAVEVKNSSYTHVIYDSDGERQYAEQLDASERVKVFTKLPSKFTVPTPLGSYNPDWAIVASDENNKDALYLVRESKFAKGKSRDEILGNLRQNEQLKIAAAKKHFSAIEVDYRESTQTDLSDTF